MKGYTETIGETLMIVTEQTGSPIGPEDKPTGKTISLTGSIVRIEWNKGKSDGIYIDSQRGDETERTQIGFDMRSPYDDERPPLVAGKPEEHRYRLRYFVDKTPVGSNSDVIVAVTCHNDSLEIHHRRNKMNVTNLTVIVTLLIALSIASERLVAIIQGVIPFLSQENVNAIKESWRKASIQLLAVISGITTALLSSPVITETLASLFCDPKNGCDQNWNATPAIFALGLLASGGSGFWNSILEYLLKVKDLKKLQVEGAKKGTSDSAPQP